MKLTIESILITDIDGKKSKKICFKDGINLITSRINSVGKSVIMKSIYHSLGADSFFDANFKKIKNLLIETEFLFGSNKYTCIRYNNLFCILKNGNYYGYYKSHRNEMAKFFEDELGMSVYLRSREGRAELAPPAYLFIPYYLDQDRSWKEEQYPFAKESMQHYYKTSANELFLYHLGVFDKSYGQLKASIDSVKDKITNLQCERSKYDEAYSQIKDSVGLNNYLINETEIESFLRSETSKINGLLNEQNNYIIEMNKLIENKSKIRLRIKENKKTIELLEKNDQVVPVITECPFCHKQYDLELKSSIINTYNMVVLENSNKSLNSELLDIENRILELKNKISYLTEKISSSDNDVKNKNSTYASYLAWKTISESKKDLLEKIRFYDESIYQADESRKELEKKKNDIKRNSEEVRFKFADYYCNYLNELDVSGVDSSMITPFYKCQLSGSQFSRSTLSLYFGFMKLKEEYNNKSFNLPLIIDSPREGEQDELNSEKILLFILNHRINSNQLIVASVNATNYISESDIKHINVIELDNAKKELLTAQDYSEEHTQALISYFEKID